MSIVWTEESWLQKYANAEDNKEERGKEAAATATTNSDEESDEEHAAAAPATSSKGGRSRVYLDISIGGSLAGRIEIEVMRVRSDKLCLISY